MTGSERRAGYEDKPTEARHVLDRHAGKTKPLPPQTGHATRRPREHAPTWKIQMAPRRQVRHGIRNKNTAVMSSSTGSKRVPRPPSAGGGDGQGTRAGP